MLQSAEHLEIQLKNFRHKEKRKFLPTSERKEDAFILQTMAEMVQAQGKFRKAAVFAIVQNTDLPIDVKSFDQTLTLLFLLYFSHYYRHIFYIHQY